MANHPPGTRLFSQGEIATAIYIVISGIVELSHLSERGECGVLMYTSGDMLMPGALFEEPYLASATVLTPARLLEVDAALVRQECTRDVSFAMQLCRVTAGQWRMAVRNILDLKCRTAAQRLGAFLLRLADEQDPGEVAELPIPKRHLAVRLGMKPETLSRTLQLIAENGLHLRGKHIIVKDRERIRQFCGPDPYPDRDEAPLGVHVL